MDVLHPLIGIDVVALPVDRHVLGGLVNGGGAGLGDSTATSYHLTTNGIGLCWGEGQHRITGGLDGRAEETFLEFLR